ncbi:glycerophosphoryl diester phosphodiesterase [Actinokineospora baliensis]|uniref:glycerophosphodiester phosphodiesterase n=1 Tax=Actinokineospora baliensis TaxID=547056 RepID=UPI0027DE89B8|nr:glycerophosphodiester phosphodiesterase [Actinokineospora baliensis]MBM7775052.1 glycerophosphoryl diester phosphodiesterase [Actinokineospora baliensis]
MPASPARHGFFDGPHPRAFVHRGWHDGDLAGMENSLAAFRRAVEHGYRYLETDVHATSDGVVVVHHDSTLERTTDATGSVAALPWRVVSQARIGGREPVSRLTDLLEELPDARINIDVKSEAAIGPVLEVLRATGAADRVCLASFSEARLARIRKLAGPGVLTSMGMRAMVAFWASRRLPAAVLRPGPRPLVAQVPVRHGPLRVVDAALIAAAKRRAAEVHVWTIDEAAQMTELLDLGVDGLMTDRPQVLKDVFVERGLWQHA